MDVQRSRRQGKANFFIVIPLVAQDFYTNLRTVQLDLETKYKNNKAELRRAFTDLEQKGGFAPLHVTLLGVHMSGRWVDLMKEALAEFEKTKPSKQKKHYVEVDRFALPLTDSADSLESSESMKQSGEVSATRSFTLELRGLGSFMTKGSNIVMHAVLTPESEFHVKHLAKELRDFVFNYLEEKSKEPRDPSGREDFPGFWMDDPAPEEYLPHVTLLNSDPDNDHELRKAILAKSGGRIDIIKKGSKKLNKRGQVGKEHAQKEIYGEFGQQYDLFRDERKAYSKISFGQQFVDKLELQSLYECHHTLRLDVDHSKQ